MAAPVNQSAYQFAEDTAHASGDRGTAILAVRRDSAGSLADTTNDYTFLQVDADGYLRVTGTTSVTGTVTVTATDLDIRNLSSSQDQVRVGYVRDPAWLGVYSYGDSVAGTATNPYTFMSLFNPAASGRDAILLCVALESYSVAASVAHNMIFLDRISAASGGTLGVGTAQFRTADTASVVEFRTGNPTITPTGAQIAQFASNQNVTAAGTTAVSRREFRPLPEWGEFLLTSGQGVALRQIVAGDADQRFVVTVVWAER